MLKAENIIKCISESKTIMEYEFRAALLAGYFDRITELNIEEVIRTSEVAKLLRWTFSKL